MRTAVWIFLVSGALLFASSGMAQRPRTQPVASLTQLMQAMIIPSSDALFNVARQSPKNDEEWAAIQNSAVILTESGNLLMIGNRAKDTGDWMKMSQEMVDAGAVALKAAESRNVDALIDAGNQIVDSCSRCHESYWDQTLQNE